MRAKSWRSRILWKNLNGDAVETFRATIFEKLSTLGEDMSASDAYQMWNTLARSIKDVTKDSVGVTSEFTRTHSIHKESWWFYEEVITKARKRRRRDLRNIRYIKDEEGRTIVMEKDIRKIWGEYFSPLFNEKRPEGSEEIFSSAKRPDEWRLSEVIPIYKNKGDAQVCSIYRGIKLLGHTMKLWERVIKRMPRRKTRVLDNQFGFMPGRSMTEAIHLLRNLIEKYRERQRDLHMVFLALEKAYDSIPHELIWRTLIDKGTPRRYLRVIGDMYKGAKTRVRSIVGNTKFFPVKVSLYQGSAISPYLFALILDELSRGFKRTSLGAWFSQTILCWLQNRRMV
ncbi:retrovirus-related pol polyprotein LINE-1 [Tanacetum coccineum]|uniref:Retrovirus-related pol polyprotein LINE-1 n=1 Tax=Tanacetum coccineum TaxID=301880 RepID=A0ABQ5DZA4_9ASTR